MRLCTFIALLAALWVGGSVMAIELEYRRASVYVVLNGLAITLDPLTGTITKLEHPEAGVLLEVTPDKAGLIDVAWPLKAFEPLRLASRFTQGAEIEPMADGVRIKYSRLGGSRDLPGIGQVGAVVKLREAPDGRSVIFSCTVHNNSDLAIPQVLFPDLLGLRPTAGEATTELKTAAFTRRPFTDMKLGPVDGFYATDANTGEWESGGLFNTMIERWWDLGSLAGGLSSYERKWGFEPRAKLWAQLDQPAGTLRLAWAHYEVIQPGERWESGEYWLTPHEAGWAKGLEAFRQWISENQKRSHPLPKHVAEGLGYRTAWMCKNYPADPEDVVWSFADLPKLAEECAECGLTELIMWGAYPSFILPFPGPFEHLGAPEELQAAVEDARERGVWIAPFVSVIQADQQTAPRYGLEVTPNTGNWTYHPEMTPRFTPPYGSKLSCVQVDINNPLWQADVMEMGKRLLARGITSLGWDQLWTTVNGKPNMVELAKRLRDQATAVDPEAAICAEELWNFEVDSDYLDYTWNWNNPGDGDALHAMFEAPRVSWNINDDLMQTMNCFASGTYMNIWPRQPGEINGADWISEHPALYRALKQCAKLRKQFLSYYTEGRFVAECLQSSKFAGGYVGGHLKDAAALIVVVNYGGPQGLKLALDMGPWLPSASGKYQVTEYDFNGNQVAVSEVSAAFDYTTQPVQWLEVALVEVRPL